MRYFSVAAVVLSCTAYGCLPCGVLEGRADVRNAQDAERYSCYAEITGNLLVNTTEGIGSISFPYLEVVGADLKIINNYNLSEMNFSALRTVGNQLSFVGNTQMEAVSGLQSLQSIHGKLEIISPEPVPENVDDAKNEILVSLDELSSLKKVGGDVVIEYNPALPTCEAERLVAQLDEIGGEVTIQGNTGTGDCN